MLTAILSDLGAAIRSLSRTPLFTITAVTTLGIGLTISVAVFSVVNAILLRPTPVEDPDNVVAISSTGQLRVLQQEPLSFLDVVDISRTASAFQAIVAHRRMPAALDSGLDTRVALGEVVTANYFEALRISPKLGRGFTQNDDLSNVVVLSHSIWQQRYGASPSALGSTIQIANTNRTIVGIADDGFTGVFRGIAPEFWIPADPIALEREESRSSATWFVHGRLAPGVTLAEADAQLRQIAARIARDYPREAANRQFAMVPLLEASVHPAVATGTLAAGSVTVLAMAGLLLIVACSNVAHLLLARSQQRSRELAIRTAMGCSRGRLVRMLAAEGLVLSTIGGLIALVLAIWTNEYLSAVQLPVAIKIDLGLRLDPSVIAFVIIAVLLSTTVFTVGPALRASRVDVAQVMNQEGSRGSTGGHRRSWTLIAQATICMVLLVFGGLAARSLQRASTIYPGFVVDDVSIANAAPALAGQDLTRARLYYAHAADELRKLPDVEGVSWIQPVPLSLNIRITRLRLPSAAGVPLQELPLTDTAIAWPSYFRTMGIPVLEGREFGDSDSSSAPAVAIVSEAFAKQHWPSVSPIGQSLAVGFPEPRFVSVVGVVANIKSRTLSDTDRAMVYTAGPQDPMAAQGATAVIRLKSRSTPGLGSITEALRRADPSVPVYDAQTLGTRIGGVLLLPRYAAGLFGGIGVVGLGLVSVGLGGVVAYWVSQRRREIGLRMALGGNRYRILWLVLSQSIWPATFGILLGGMVAVVGARALTAVLYGISPADPLTLIGTAVAVLVAAATAALPPALRAIKVDPAESLRQE